MMANPLGLGCLGALGDSGDWWFEGSGVAQVRGLKIEFGAWGGKANSLGHEDLVGAQ